MSRATTGLIAHLRAQFHGRVIDPGHPGYDAARTVFIGGIDRRPAAIVRVRDAADVIHLVGLARSSGLELAIRGGGHGGAGHAVTDGGIVLDLSRMRAVEIDARGRTAWAETGLTARGYSSAVGAHGLATGFGDTGSVGIGGITLGGGVGPLVRKHGLTVDSLLAAEVVTADGDLVRADAGTHPDLFWAIRGGGGNFGVATRLRFRLDDVPAVVAGTLMLPATPEVLRRFVAEADAAPDELSGVITVMPAGLGGTPVVHALMCYAGPAEAGQRALAPFRALATPIADTLRPMSYPEVYGPDDPLDHPRLVVRTLFADTFGAAEAELVLDGLRSSDASTRLVQLRVLGGAVRRVPDDATAFAHRRRRIIVNVAASYTGPGDRGVRKAWAGELGRALSRGEPGAYVNFLTEDDAGRVRAAYPGATWDRLAEIKRRYDPANLFRLNHNIPPAQEKR